LDRDLRIGTRRRPPDDSQLLVAWLVAGHFHVLWVDLFAEAGHLVSTEKVGARDDTAAILDRHGHLGIGNCRAVGVAHETEIRRPSFPALAVAAADARPPPPRGERTGAALRGARARHSPATPNRGIHPVLPQLHPRAAARRRPTV